MNLERVIIVNQIIEEIAKRGDFFHYEGRTAYLFLKNNKIYYRCEYYDRDICLSTKYSTPKNWIRGNTLLCLIKDFREYIKTGEDCNGMHGRGGLYSKYWGYEEKDMIEIRIKAIELGYLRSFPHYDLKLKKEENYKFEYKGEPVYITYHTWFNEERNEGFTTEELDIINLRQVTNKF